MNDTSYTNRACPFFGLKDDADTLRAFPSVGNGCHRNSPIASPNLKHQAEYCLTENHPQCQVFLNQLGAVPPPDLPHIQANAPKRKPSQTFALIFFVGFLGLIGLVWKFLLPNLIQPSTMPIDSVTQLPAAIETSTLTVSDIKEPVATNTVTHTPAPILINTAIPSPTFALPKRQLDMPLGTIYQFVIHKVLGGENFNRYADQYNTSVEAIVGVNYNLKTPVWVGTPVIIPVGFTDVSSLPAFEAYEVNQAGHTIETLAQELDVSTEDLTYYNSIDTSEVILVGDWLLVPRSKPVP